MKAINIFLSICIVLSFATGMYAGECNDGIDNDGDGLVDWEFDLGCYNADDPTERVTNSGELDNGWTVFKKSDDTKIIYISSSTGDDANDGLTSGAAIRTLAKGRQLMEAFGDSLPNWMLLRRGDTWNEAIPQWRISGRSKTERLVIGSYGISLQRPRLVTGTASGFDISKGGGSPAQVEYWAIIDLHFDGVNSSPSAFRIGPGLATNNRGCLIENVLMDSYETNAGIFAQVDMAIRRNVVIDAYSTNGHSQGMYIDNCDGVLMEENIFDHNGWNENVIGAEATVYNHNIYFTSSSSGLVFIGNITSRASATGIQARAGGIVSQNLFVRDPLALNFGFMGGGSNPVEEGVSGEVSWNVFLEGNDLNGSARGIGVMLGNISAANVADNVFAHYASAERYGGAITIVGDIENEDDIGVNNLKVERNIVYEWATPIGIINGIPGVDLTNITISDNTLINPILYPKQGSALINHNVPFSQQIVFEGNSYYTAALENEWFRANDPFISYADWTTISNENNSTRLTGPGNFSDPNRTLGMYQDFITGGSGGTVEDFLAQARLQSKVNWREEYTALKANDFIRAGFDKSTPVKEDGVINTLKNILHIYPNPVTALVNIKIQNSTQSAEIEIFSLSGIKVFSNYNINGNYLVLDAQKFTSGIYVVQLTIDDKIHNLRMLVN